MSNEQTHITHKTRNKRARTSVAPRQDTYKSRSVVTSTLSTAALQVSQRPSANASAISSSVSASLAFAIGFSELVVSNHSGSFKATANVAFKVSSMAGSLSSATHLRDTSFCCKLTRNRHPPPDKHQLLSWQTQNIRFSDVKP